jgi:hypothetical protein
MIVLNFGYICCNGNCVKPTPSCLTVLLLPLLLLLLLLLLAARQFNAQRAGLSQPVQQRSALSDSYTMCIHALQLMQQLQSPSSSCRQGLEGVYLVLLQNQGVAVASRCSNLTIVASFTWSHGMYACADAGPAS